ncbi:hypothetical protein G9A89_005611 [Geosiphon pyriformis]|nr:hypothetical protein G9A89_005611 [Geosiphon pyriformis]
MTYIGKFNKLFRRIRQLETNNYYSDAQILDQFITGLKDKLIKKVRSYAPDDLNSAIQHAKRRKLPQDQQNRSNQHYSPLQQFYYQPPLPAYYLSKSQYQNNYYQSTPQPIQQQYQQPPTQHYQVSAQRLITQKQFTSQNQYQVNNNRISSNNQLVSQNSIQPRPNYYYTQSSYLTMPEEQDFHHTALLEGRAVAQQQNPSYTSTTIPPARIAENANLSDIFPFEFEANESSFLLSNTATNEQKAITAMYTEAEVEGKTICLILDTQTVIVTADDMKKTPVGEINNFPFTLDGITILVKVLVMDTPQYQALVENNWLQKANANLNWETQELTISYQGQHAWVPAICGIFNKHSKKAPAFEFELEEEKPIIETFMALGLISNWANETEQQGTLFDAAYNSALNKLYHYSHDAEMIFNLAMALINGATQKNVCQMKESEYIAYTFEITGYNYENEVEVYHQIASHTYPTKKAQAQWLEQINIKLCEKCIMSCNEQWCPKCYALSISLSSKNDENKIEFGKPKAMEEIETTPIYLIENQPAL